MNEELDMYFEMSEDSMKSSIDHLRKELLRINTGKATPSLLNGVSVEYYGNSTPLHRVSNISTSDARTLVIQPWEKALLAPIERAIFAANLGLTPMNNGEIIRIGIPPLTEERRHGLVKQVKGFAEDTKVGIRGARRELMESIKNAVKDGFSEDEGKIMEANAQTLTNKYSTITEDLIKAKEKDIMTI